MNQTEKELLSRVPAAEPGTIRIIGSKKGYDELGPERLEELNRQLRGNRGERRRARAVLAKHGFRVVGAPERPAGPLVRQA